MGILVSYANTKKENNKTLLENVKYSDITKFSVSSAGGYFFKKHFSVGLGFDYGAEKENIESINTFGPNTVSDRNVKTYTLIPFIRNYFPLGDQHKFFMFTETGLEFEFGNGSELSSTGSTSTTADIKTNNYGIAFVPGIIFLAEKGFAFEVNVWVQLANLKWSSPEPTLT